MRNAESTDCGLRIADCGLKTGNADVSSATMLPHAESSSAAPGNPQSNNPQSSFRIPVSRRALLGLGVGGGWALLARRSLTYPHQQPIYPILPPGAVERRTFNGLCIRCGACVRACPHRIIHPSTGQHGLAALLTPTLNFEQDYCRPDCVACTRVCPSGALRPLLLKEKTKIRLARPVVNRETCLQVQSGNCNECANACYFDAIHGSAPREGDSGGEPVVDLKRCIGCGACEMICPAQPRAIVMRGED
jgi:ferredoxin